MRKTVLSIMLTASLCGCGSTNSSNPLLHAAGDETIGTPHGTPKFREFTIEYFREALNVALDEAKKEFEAIIQDKSEPTFENTVEAMERSGAMLSEIEGIFYALENVESTDESQALVLEIEPKLVEFSNDVNLNPTLFARVKQVYDKRESLGLSKEQKKLLEDSYKGFIRSGAGLNDADKQTYRELSAKLSNLTTTFGQNVLAQTNAWVLNIPKDQASRIEELPGFVKEAMASEAKARGQEGWTVSLQSASMTPFLTYSSDRELKEQIWRKSNTKCLESEANDNAGIMKEIAQTRFEIARLLGYETYADYVLEERMAKDRVTVTDFLQNLLDATYSYAQKDYKDISDFAARNGATYQIMPWDFGYWSEKYKNEKYSFNEEEVKPYLELNSVKDGIFNLANSLYGITFKANPDIQVYNPEVQAYEVYEQNGDFIGVIYMDFFPRESKRGGAWMTSYRSMYTTKEGKEVRPFVTLCTNFTKATETTPALLTFSELTTFLHEFGHCLHGLFAEGTYASQTGTSVFRDFVELPSQVMENWATEPEFLNTFAKHYKTGEKMPQELIDKVVSANNYLAAYANCRQLQYGMVDMAWHTITEPVKMSVEAFEKQSMAPAQILPLVDGTAMTPAFTHIFSGGYAAGYYSYKWSEVLDADAFQAFKETGDIFSKEVAASFRKNVLSKGSTEHPMDLYVRFRGHEPQVDALIKRIT